jgi:hypothetical protein
MLCGALGAAERAAALAAAAGAGVSSLDGGGGASAGGGGAALPPLAVELVGALSQGAFAESLADYAELACASAGWDGHSGRGDGGVGSGAVGQGNENGGGGLSPEEWAAGARAEAAVKAAALAAALLARAAAGAGGGRGLLEGLSKVTGSLAAIGNRIASMGVPEGVVLASRGGAGGAAERRAAALRALQTAASGLRRAAAAGAGPRVLPAWGDVEGWAAAAAGIAAAPACGGADALGVNDTDPNPINVDWSCLAAVLDLLEALGDDVTRGQPQAAAGQLPEPLLLALFPAALDALRWTPDEAGLLEVVRCARRLWAAALAAPPELQVRHGPGRPFLGVAADCGALSMRAGARVSEG